jgi:vacuolar protein sorting-associated protein 35
MSSGAPNKAQRRDDGQASILEQASKMVAKEAFFMKRAVDKNELKTVLKHAAGMLNELRTGLLLPKNYYELYMRVCDELHHLEAYFASICAAGANGGGQSVVELYQQVQHCGNVLPRLYLLATVGAVYIRSKEAPAKDILKDLVEMTKGVQHPTRGLFLRSFLSQQTKDKLPDTNSDYEGEGGDITDAIDFVLQNFCEMNRLWVRMQRQGSSKAKRRKRREKERQQLRILVGTNLVRLSQLEGVDLGCYTETVLPRVLEEVANCKDHIAQQYLMDCVIQVFPDEFHVKTLQPFLEACTTLDDKVEVKAVLVTLMDRIANWFKEGNAIPEDVPAFKLLMEYVAKVIQAKSAMEVNDILELQCALQSFASTCYADTCKSYVDNILGFSAAVLERVVGGGDSGDKASGGADDEERTQLPEDSVRLVVQLLTTPQQVLGLEVLTLKHYSKLQEQLGFVPRKKVAMKLLRSVTDKSSTLDTPERLESLFAFVAPLMKDQSDTVPFDELSDPEKETFATEQRLVGRLISLMRNDDDAQLFQIYTVARKHFGKGGMNRIRYTLVPLVFGYIGLAGRLKRHGEEAGAAAAEKAAAAAANPEEDDEEGGGEAGAAAKANEDAGAEVRAKALKKASKAAKKVFQFVHEILTVLAGVDEYQNIALHMFLEATLAADAFKFEPIGYEFLSRAFALYEDTANSRLQVRIFWTHFLGQGIVFVCLTQSCSF